MRADHSRVFIGSVGLVYCILFSVGIREPTYLFSSLGFSLSWAVDRPLVLLWIEKSFEYYASSLSHPAAAAILNDTNEKIPTIRIFYSFSLMIRSFIYLMPLYVWPSNKKELFSLSLIKVQQANCVVVACRINWNVSRDAYRTTLQASFSLKFYFWERIYTGTRRCT